MHPHRFGLFGRCSWHGRIYGSGATGLPLVPERIYYGTFGFAPFQAIIVTTSMAHGPASHGLNGSALRFFLQSVFCSGRLF